MELDYITITNKTYGKSEIPILEGYEEEKFIAWQAGPALYEGSHYRYKEGTLSILWSDLQGLLVRASGGIAERIYRELNIELYKVTRIDIKFDIRKEIDLLYWYRKQKEESTKIKTALINNETLYIGSRKSMRFWRVYNKASEQGLEEILFRIELELKDIRAEQAKFWLSSEDKRRTLFKTSAIGIISQLLDSLGVYAEEGDLTLPRKRPSERLFFKKVVVPFLKKNKWAVEELSREGLYE